MQETAIDYLAEEQEGAIGYRDFLNQEAERDPNGPREYWRKRSVRIERYGEDGHPMTDADFELKWSETEGETDAAKANVFATATTDMVAKGRAFQKLVKTMDGPGIVIPDGFPHPGSTDEMWEAVNDPRGPREYWRELWVGKLAAKDGHILTDAELDAAWDGWKPFDADAFMRRRNEAAEQASHETPDVTAPAGEYFLGDPGYAVEPHENWMHLLESCNYFEKPTGQLPDGTEVIAFSTAYGDGFFPDNHGNEYPVDAGLIGLVPVTPATEAALADTEATAQAHGAPHQFMTRVSFAEPVECTRTGLGLLTFGPYQIDTAGEVDEDGLSTEEHLELANIGKKIAEMMITEDVANTGKLVETVAARGGSDHAELSRLLRRFTELLMTKEAGGDLDDDDDTGFAAVSWTDDDGHAIQAIVTPIEFPFLGTMAAETAAGAAGKMSSQFRDAMAHPGGAREYWRDQMVGKSISDKDGHVMTAEEYDAAWDAAEASAEAEKAELDRLNEEAQRDPRVPKEFWRERVVGIEPWGEDDHPMTDEEFEAEWAEREAELNRTATHVELEEGDYFVGSPDGDLHRCDGEGTSVTIATKVGQADYVWRDHRTKITTPAAKGGR
jgi:hypothetical protein